jgi:CBS domain-containing protein
VLAAHREPESTTVSEVCSEDLISALPDQPVSEAVELMREYAIRRLPVIAADGQPQGVLTIGDLAVTDDPQSALADISAAPPNK